MADPRQPSKSVDSAGEGTTSQLREAQSSLSGWRHRLRSMDRFRFTVTRPVAVLMVFFAVMVFGLFSARMLPTRSRSVDHWG